MSSAVEWVVLLVAIGAVVYLIVDLVRIRMRDLREKSLLDRLANEQPTVVVAAEEPSIIERRLRAAGLRGPVEAYVFGASLLAVAASVITLRSFAAFPLAALIVFAFALYLPWTFVTEWAKRRGRKFEQALIEAIDLMAGSLYAGGNLSQAFRNAGSVAEEPVRSQFNETDRRLALGMPLNRALGGMQEEFDGEGVRLFTQTLVAKSQSGGDLAPVLKALNETLRDRWRQQRQVQAQLAGARVSAIAVAVLPYLLIPLLVAMQPEWMRTLLSHPLGQPLLLLAVMLQLVGVLWLWNILRREL